MINLRDLIEDMLRQNLRKFDLTGKVTIKFDRNLHYEIVDGDIIRLHKIELAYDDASAKDSYRFQSRGLFRDKVQALAQLIDETGVRSCNFYSSLTVSDVIDLPDGGIGQDIIITEIVYQKSVI